MRKIELGEVVGKGRVAEIIYWGNNRVLKLFYKDFPKNLIDQQFKIDSIVGEIFPNCPKAFEKIEEYMQNTLQKAMKMTNCKTLRDVTLDILD